MILNLSTPFIIVTTLRCRGTLTQEGRLACAGLCRGRGLFGLSLLSAPKQRAPGLSYQRAQMGSGWKREGLGFKAVNSQTSKPWSQTLSYTIKPKSSSVEKFYEFHRISLVMTMSSWNKDNLISFYLNQTTFLSFPGPQAFFKISSSLQQQQWEMVFLTYLDFKEK